MRKILLIVVAISFATVMNAQFYIGVNAGYGVGAGKSAIGSETSGTKTTNIYGSFGKGINLGLNPGFMFTENLGVQFGVNYLMGGTQTLYKDANEIMEGKSNGLRLTPQLVVKLENGLYSRFGMIVPVMGKTVVTDVDNDYYGSGQKLEAEFESVGSFSTGFIGSVGYGYKMSDNMTLFGEVEYISLLIKSGTRTITKYDVAGVDQLANMTTSQKETEYVDEIDSATVTTTSEPSKALKDKTVFSSFGVNFGIIMNF
jgi:hypothetical protein